MGKRYSRSPVLPGLLASSLFYWTPCGKMPLCATIHAESPHNVALTFCSENAKTMGSGSAEATVGEEQWVGPPVARACRCGRSVATQSACRGGWPSGLADHELESPP